MISKYKSEFYQLISGQKILLLSSSLMLSLSLIQPLNAQAQQTSSENVSVIAQNNNENETDINNGQTNSGGGFRRGQWKQRYHNMHKNMFEQELPSESCSSPDKGSNSERPNSTGGSNSSEFGGQFNSRRMKRFRQGRAGQEMGFSPTQDMSGLPGAEFSSGPMQGPKHRMDSFDGAGPMVGRRGFPGAEKFSGDGRFSGGGFRRQGGAGGHQQLDLTPLALNDQQKQKIQQMREQSKEKVKELRKNLFTKQQELKSLMFSPDATPDQIKSARKALRASQEQIEETTFNDLMSIRGLLTAEQKKHLPECMPGKGAKSSPSQNNLAQEH